MVRTCPSVGLVGVGFVTGIETSWGDIGARMGLVVGGGSLLHLLGCPITLVFGSEVVGRDSVAFGIVSLANVVVVGLGQVGSSLGMTGAQSVGWEFVVGGSE